MLSSLEVYFKQPTQTPTGLTFFMFNIKFDFSQRFIGCCSGTQSSVPSADSWLHVRLPLSNPAVKADYQLFHTKFIRVGKVFWMQI
jgi:hypothetical protein